MSTSRRSTTGCTTCKTRRKKCDETKPRCLRCLASERPCSYEYIKPAGAGKYWVERTRPGPRPVSELSTKGYLNTPADTREANVASSSTPAASGSLPVLPNFIPPIEWSDKTHPSTNPIVPWNLRNYHPLPLPSLPLGPLQPPSDFYSVDLWHASPNIIQAEARILETYHTIPSMYGPSFQGSVWAWLDDDNSADDYDPEGVRLFLCMTPTVDKNLKENTLPFVLHCYSEWAITRFFDPLKVVHFIRDQVIQQFSSNNTRARAILLANVMVVYTKNLAIDETRISILNHLANEVGNKGSSFMATPSTSPELDRQIAMRTLDSMLEVLAIQISTQPSAICVKLLDHAAPVFRRACVEPPGHPINLPNILLQPNLNLRHFASIDIMLSVTTGRPSYFRYEVPFSLELCDRIYQLQDDYGMQWLHGFPDQYVMLFAWINSLSETQGASDNSELVAWIDDQLPQIELAVSKSGDPALRIGRMVVQECWRFAVQIYLYMVLDKANALDPRIICAHKEFMRLVGTTKPGRNPDAHLVSPMVVAGVATVEEDDRDTLRQRILGLRECSELGTAGNDVIRELEEIWKWTRDEGRVAVWSDLRVAHLKVTE